MSSLLERFNRPVVAILVITAVTGVLRFWDLGRPTGFVFDEVYYAKAGCIFIGGSDQMCRIDSSNEHYWVEHKWDVGSWVHPPLGKWMTGMGIKAFGMDAFGWRFASALAGTLIATMLALIAYVLFGSVVWTYVAGLLVAVEHLNHVMARTALLDIHLEFWIVLGFLCLVLDRRWIDRRTPEWLPDPEPLEPEPGEAPQALPLAGAVVARRAARRTPSPIWRPWRFAAGVALGASVSVKWSGITALGAAVMLSYLWETTRRARGDLGRWRAFGRTLAIETFGMVLAFAIVPLAVYMITWLPWFHHFGWSLKVWWENQTASWDYHKHLTEFALDSKTDTYTPTHPYYSKAWEWIPMLRPISFYVRDLGPDIRQVLAIGNPMVFWFTAWTIPYAAFSWRRKRDWRAGFVVLPFLIMWLPWMLVSRPQFFFYALPLTPFMILAAVYALRDMSDAKIVLRDDGPAVVESNRHPYRPLVWAYLVLAVGLFAWFWPVLVGTRLSDTLWRARVWFRGWI
ncbi:MAG: phospholipid carrier-dependent glycosyltransferase [Actinomycetota bacterium]